MIRINSHLARTVAVVVALTSAASGALAQDPCGLCDKEVVTNSSLADCFLSAYQELALQTGSAIVVDLSSCEATSRGVVEALPTPNSGTAAPDTEFMVSRSQLECLKKKLEEPGLVLDPTATIELESC